MTTTMVMLTKSLAEVKARLSSFVTSVHDTHERVVITRNGEPAAVLISPEDLESQEETLAVLSDPAAIAEIADTDAAIARGDVVPPRRGAAAGAFVTHRIVLAPPARRAIENGPPVAVAAWEFTRGPLAESVEKIRVAIACRRGQLTDTRAVDTAARGVHYRPHGRLLLGDSVRLLEQREGALLFLGEPQGHGHDPMIPKLVSRTAERVNGLRNDGRDRRMRLDHRPWLGVYPCSASQARARPR